MKIEPGKVCYVPNRVRITLKDGSIVMKEVKVYKLSKLAALPAYLYAVERLEMARKEMARCEAELHRVRMMHSPFKPGDEIPGYGRVIRVAFVGADIEYVEYKPFAARFGKLRYLWPKDIAELVK